jgi:hypothetical protein
MQQDIIRNIVDKLNFSTESDKEEKIIFGRKGYNSFFIDKKNFNPIIKSETCRKKKIAFIDGGNAEIIGSTDFSVQFIRTYCCVFEGCSKVDEIKNEFFILAESFAKNDDVSYGIKIYPVSGNLLSEDNDFSINSMDEKITEGGRRAKIAKAGEIARRIAEIKLAEYIVENEKAQALVFDGTLECAFGEEEHLDRIYENALIKEITVCALAKTTNLFTGSGKNALSCIFRMHKDGIWQYNNIAEIDSSVKEHKADISIAKLNEKSRHCFRFEIFNRQKDKRDDILSCLADNSRDLSFPGYPYGLIKADRSARVSNKEKEYLKSMFLAKAGKEIIENMISSDAHDVLNTIN